MVKILGLYDETDFSLAGGKARGLNMLARAGFNVPSGFVLCDITSPACVEQAAEYYQQSGLGVVAVRSSATLEDGQDFSAAGQYSTYLNVSTRKDFVGAVEGCIASLHGKTATSYNQLSAGANNSMNIVVQQMVLPTFAGVCFTVSPTDKNCVLIEAVEGLGEALVSGTAGSYQYSVPRTGDEDDIKNLIKQQCSTHKMLGFEMVFRIYSEALRAEKEFGYPLDLEFACCEDELFWLQARAVTVLDEDGLGEFDPTYNMDGMTITRCNIGEMLPSAVTPLTISTTLYSIDYGMREMLNVAGVTKQIDDLPKYSCALSVCNHLFINLSSLYKMDSVVIGARKEAIELSLCGRALDTPLGDVPRANLFKRLSNGMHYFGFVLGSKKAVKRLSALADNVVIGEGCTTIEQLYRDIDSKKYLGDKAMTLHYVTSSHSGAMSSAMFQVLIKSMDEETAKGAVARLLENIDGIESTDILRSLRILAREILSAFPDAADFSAEQLKSCLENGTDNVKNAHQYFLNKHGHRCIREAEMRNKGWADDESAFLCYLKTVVASGGGEAERAVEIDVKNAIRELGLRGSKARILRYLTNQARTGVVNREHSKSRIVKVMDIFKRAYSRLASLMCEEGLLPDSDLIYFLAHEEIGRVIAGESALVKKAHRRRRQLPEQVALSFADVSVGKPVPLPPPVLEGCSVIKGTPISRGVVTGVARVVRSEAEARELKKGEIMVAQYTDIGWSPYYCLVGGLVTEVGSALSHGAVVAREYSLPLVANAHNATHLIRTGDTITVNGTTGEITLLAE